MKLSNKEKLEAYSFPEPNTGCWLWARCTDRDGYGVFCIRDRRHWRHLDLESRA